MRNHITYFLIPLLLLSIQHVKAESDNNINFDSLLQKSDAVIMERKLNIEISDEKEAVYYIYSRILIKNEQAEKYCKFSLMESEFKEFDDISARILDTNGEPLKELESGDIEEVEYSAENFYNGTKYLLFQLTHNIYPYYIEYSYRVRINSLLLWPSWFPQSGIPVLYSEYILKIDPEIKFNFYSKGLEVEAETMHINSSDIYSWRLKNVLPVADEDYLPPEDEEQMCITFIPKDFETAGYKGSTENWNEFARWYRTLAEGHYNLPESATQEILDLIRNVTDTKEKIKILYKYLQTKNRYVAIEMGLAGWQPNSAANVFINRYGDCKDLSTFMIAILKIAGIESYPALACTRDNGVVNPDYPSNQFNHCIVFVPLEKDTIWLECTSPYSDMGEMNNNIEDIYTLVVDNTSGNLIKTPQKKSLHNKWISTINASLVFGDLNFNSKIIATGNQKSYLRTHFVVSDSKEDVEFLTSLLSENYSNLNIKYFNLSSSDISVNNYDVELQGTYLKFAPADGNRLFINPAIYNRKSADEMPKEEISKRKFPVFFSFPYQNIDTVIITFPGKYKVESKPSNQQIENDIVNYTSEFDIKDGRLFYVRLFELKKNFIELKNYPLFYETIKKIIEFDKAKFVLKKN